MELREVIGRRRSIRFKRPYQQVGTREHPANGQWPRQPFEKLFGLNEYGTPFPRSDEVIEELIEDDLFTRPAPIPGREAELERPGKALDIPGSGLI